MKKLLISCIVGSRARGYSLPESDIDIRGVFLEDFNLVLSGMSPNEMKTREGFDSDDSLYYELSHFANLLIKGNLKFVEILFSNTEFILYKDETFNSFLEIRDNFITENYFNSIKGYLFNEVKLLKKRDFKKAVKTYCLVQYFLHSFNYASTNKTLDGLYEEFRQLNLYKVRENPFEFFGTNSQEKVVDLIWDKLQEPVTSLKIPVGFKKEPERKKVIEIVCKMRLENR